MTDLPDPAAVRGEPALPGFHYEWVPSENWVAVSEGESKPCRFTTNRMGCKAPSVAKLWRVGTVRPSWWHYCGEHLCGRFAADGVVWTIRTVRDTEPASGGHSPAK